MAEEKDTAAPAKRTAGKTGRRKKPEAEHAARAAPQDKDTGSKAQELLEQARTEPKPEWEVAEQVVLLPLDRLRPFKNHPFKVNDEDELMQDTIDSIMAGGVINPILVRPAEDGKFEVVSGHRRFRASELAGKADIKAIVREMDDDTAVITMVDSNLQRENILPSERAFSYRMKMEALTHQGQRTDPTLRQLGAKFRTAELVGQPAGDSARQVQRFIRLTELIPQLLDMIQLVESVKERGVITPATVRQKEDGRYELISGHRRKRACELAGFEALRCEVVDLDRDAATVLMVESNFQRSQILPSEKAFAYKMRLDAMKRQAGRPSKDNSVPVAQNYEGKTSRELLGEQVGESQDQVRRYIRLTNLVPELLDLVDEGKIKMRPAVELSYLDEDSQRAVVDEIDLNQSSLTQAVKPKRI